jgi:hypothetical protein
LGAAVVSVPVPHPLPAASVTDLVNEAIPSRVLATPEAWQEWLAEHNGETAWVDGELAPETRFMARAKPGDLAGGYVKSVATRNGQAVWERVH